MSTRRPIYLPTYLYIHSDESRYMSIYMFSPISVYFDTFSRGGRTGLMVRASDSGSGDPVRSSARSVCLFP